MASSIVSYATLQSAVADWLDRSDLTTQIKDFIAFGEERLNRRLRIREFETALSSTISSGVIAVPSGYLEMKYAYVNSTPTSPLIRADIEYIYKNYPTRSSDGKPAYYAREAGNFIFGPYPNDDYVIKGVYYAAPTALSDSNTTNFYTDSAPELILYSSLLSAEAFLQNDERLPVWNAAYKELVEDIQSQEDDEYLSGSSIAVTVENNP